jgi:hypothetical protein
MDLHRRIHRPGLLRLRSGMSQLHHDAPLALREPLPWRPCFFFSLIPPLLTTPGRIRQCPRRRRLPPHHVLPLHLRPRHPDIRLQPRLFLRRPLHHLHRRFTRSSTRDYAWIHNHRHWSHNSSVKLLCRPDDGRTHRCGCRDGNEYSHRWRVAS